MKPGELVVTPAYSSIPKSPASISLGYSSRGFEILPPLGRDREVPRFAKHRFEDK